MPGEGGDEQDECPGQYGLVETWESLVRAPEALFARQGESGAVLFVQEKEFGVFGRHLRVELVHGPHVGIKVCGVDDVADASLSFGIIQVAQQDGYIGSASDMPESGLPMNSRGSGAFRGNDEGEVTRIVLKEVDHDIGHARAFVGTILRPTVNGHTANGSDEFVEREAHPLLLDGEANGQPEQIKGRDHIDHVPVAGMRRGRDHASAVATEITTNHSPVVLLEDPLAKREDHGQASGLERIESDSILIPEARRGDNDGEDARGRRRGRRRWAVRAQAVAGEGAGGRR